MFGSVSGRRRWISWCAIAAVVMLAPIGPQAWNWASDHYSTEPLISKEAESEKLPQCPACDREKSSKESNSALTSGWCPCEEDPPMKLCFLADNANGNPVTITYPTPENSPPDLDFDGIDTWKNGYFRVVDGTDTYDVKFDMQGDLTCEIGEWSLLMEVTKNGVPWTPYATAGAYWCDPLKVEFVEAFFLTHGSITVTVFECP